MAEALVSPVVEQLVSIMARELEREVRLVVGVENAVDQLTSNLTAIKAVLADAETRQVKEAIVRDWLEKLRDVAYDIEDVLDDWEAAILSSQSKRGDEQDPKKPERKVCSFLRSSCFCCKQIGQRHDIARKIKELNERLDRIAQERYRYHFDERENNPPIERPMTTSLIDITEVKGREEDKNVLVNKLLSEPSDGDGSDPRVLSIVGMGGIGKTTLAQYAFNHDRIKAHFGNNKFWVCVSDPFDETRVAKAILKGLEVSTLDVTELEHLHREIGKSIKDKRFLLILDDVWEENDPSKWNRLKQSLKFGSPESKILVTTRNERVARVMDCYGENVLKVKVLSDEDCWLIINKIACFGRRDIDCKNLEKIGREISKKCRGLPLAAMTLGGILKFRGTREEWENILNNEIWRLEAQSVVIAPLWLSYYDLSPALKRCFSYCAIFPKDHVIGKKKLIELWMAQGYLKKGGQSDDLEITGEIYFQNLSMRSFFQVDADNDGGIFSCKMHDIVHDFAQNVARNEVNFQAESISGSLSSSKVRHLRLDCTDGTPSFNSFDGTKKLRSLLFSGSSYMLPLTTEDLSRLFSESTHVRSLSLRYGDFAEIPPSICKLVQLRWLDLSRNHALKQLPETLCELQSLQTIDVSECDQLEQLPLGIGKLINLRHLHNWVGPIRLPKGIGQLTGLRTLEVVDVDGGGDAFSLGDLKNLNRLGGRLAIHNLGKYNRHVGEAEQAELKKKERVTNLFLHFGGGQEGCTPRNVELLLEALEPSPYLETLEIYNYKGPTFPGWMISLTNLRSIDLSWCVSCEHLPSLGKLPSLETLVVMGMDSVKKVGRELLGIETQIGDSKSEISASSSSSPVVVAFPKLTTLQFRGMESWEEWEDYCDGTTKPPPIIIMPSLRSLFILNCRRLKALPDYILQSTTLHTLEIKDCRSCERLPSLGKLPSLEFLCLSGMEGVKKVGLELLGIETQSGDSKSEISASSSSSPVVVAFPKLTTLEFAKIKSWEEWEDYYDGTTKPPPIIIMPSLRSLKIRRCPRLKALPDYILQSTTLHTLEIKDCRSCERLPSLGKLPSLEFLCLSGMEGVKKVGLELLGIETQSGDSKSEISASSSSSPVVVAFPKLTTLRFFRNESWEEWEDYYDGTTKPPIIIMPSLRTLEIRRCPRLKALPDYILQSTTLHTLEIEDCDLLEERYNKEKGEDWSKISHICDVRIYAISVPSTPPDVSSSF